MGRWRRSTSSWLCSQNSRTQFAPGAWARKWLALRDDLRHGISPMEESGPALRLVLRSFSKGGLASRNVPYMFRILKQALWTLSNARFATRNCGTWRRPAPLSRASPPAASARHPVSFHSPSAEREHASVGASHRLSHPRARAPLIDWLDQKPAGESFDTPTWCLP